MKIYMNHLPFTHAKGTDYKMVAQFKWLGDIYSDLVFYYPKDCIYALLANFIILWNYSFIDRLSRMLRHNLSFLYIVPLQNHTLGYEYKRGDFDVAFMRGEQYVDLLKVYNDDDTVVLWEALFIDPAHIDGNMSTEKMEQWERDVLIMEERSKRKMVINLRSDYSVKLAQELFPDAKAKFVNAFFPIKDYQTSILKRDEIIRKHYSLEENEPITFLFCGEDAERKGLVNLIKAFEHLREKYKKRVLLIVISKQAIQVIPEIREVDGVTYLGELKHEKALEQFKRAHIYIMPSLFESFGLSYIEGLSSGCVVIARDFEPQREILDYGECGILINPFSVSDIYNAMDRVVLWGNEDRLHIALKGWEKFGKAYSYEKVAKKWHEVFNLAYAMK